jgi:membrane protease YdiL (CAAX protease family)
MGLLCPDGAPLCGIEIKVSMKQAVAVSLALVLLSNSLALFTYATGLDRQLVYVPWALVLLMAALWWTRTPSGPSWAEIGLSGGQWKQSAVLGTVSGLAIAVPLVLFLAFPFLLAEPIRYREIQDLDVLGLLWRLGVELTVATVLTEEILFRGILQALFKRSLRTTQALISTNVVFALWHLVINALSIQQNMLVLPLIPPVVAQAIGYHGSLIAVGIGGLILSILRERTNHLAGSIGMHWLTVAAMTLLIYLR